MKKEMLEHLEEHCDIKIPTDEEYNMNKLYYLHNVASVVAQDFSEPIKDRFRSLDDEDLKSLYRKVLNEIIEISDEL